MQPLVSVVVCAFNEERFIGSCLRSLVSQSVDFEYEIVVVDDASDDATGEAVEPFLRNGNISLQRNSSQLGIGASANAGILSSRGRFVVRVDADDYVSESFLSMLIVTARETSSELVRAVRCDYTVVDENGLTIARRNSEEFPIACGILWERDAMVAVGLYSKGRRVHEDVEFEARFESMFKIHRLSVPLYRYRFHARNSVGPANI